MTKTPYVLTGSAAKIADKTAIFDRGIPSLLLMQNACEASFEVIFEKITCDTDVLVASGVGNNGADGLLIASLLREQGCHVTAIVIGDTTKATEEFKVQAQTARDHGVKIVAFEGTSVFRKIRAENTILVDAIFGIGLHRDVEGAYREAIDGINGLGDFCYTYAIDVPSGIDSDTGKLMGAGIAADETLTFGCLKTGLLTGDGESFSGKINVLDIGIPDEIYENLIGESL